jgi:hypothetical protein
MAETKKFLRRKNQGAIFVHFPAILAKKAETSRKYESDNFPKI